MCLKFSQIIFFLIRRVGVVAFAVACAVWFSNRIDTTEQTSRKQHLIWSHIHLTGVKERLRSWLWHEKLSVIFLKSTSERVHVYCYFSVFHQSITRTSIGFSASYYVPVSQYVDRIGVLIFGRSILKKSPQILKLEMGKLRTGWLRRIRREIPPTCSKKVRLGIYRN